MLKGLYNTLNVNSDAISLWTDSYFTNTRACVEADGDVDVTYAVFVRTPTVFAPDMVAGWLKEVARTNGFNITLQSPYAVGDIVPAGKPQLYISGSFSRLVETETLLLQKVGAVGVAAYNAMLSCQALPHVPFIAMGARHCAGTEMQEMMDYAASIGTIAAKKIDPSIIGFVNGASDATAHFFDKEKGAGTMPHALIGYYGSTLRAAQAFRRKHPDKPFIVLNDYFGREISDAIEVANAFPAEAANGTLGFRIDTNGARFMEGLDHDRSIEIIHRHAPHMMNEMWSDAELKTLYGQGVSVASIWHFKEEMRKAGFPNVGCFGSSGFGPEKCRLMARAQAPLTGVGTGSYIPKDFHATYATADIFLYGGNPSVKVGREYLAESYGADILRLVQL